MVVRMKDPVRHEGEITTIDELDKRGLIDFKEEKNFHTGKKSIIAYFADIKGTEEGWQIGKLAYLSRTRRAAERDIVELKTLIERRRAVLKTGDAAALCELLEGDRRYK